MLTFLHLQSDNQMALRVEWDPAKARRNRTKHGVAFEDAQLACEDPAHVVRFDRSEDREERWHLLGMVGGVVLLPVVHTYPDPDDQKLIHIVSARKATRHERRSYEEDA